MKSFLLVLMLAACMVASGQNFKVQKSIKWGKNLALGESLKIAEAKYYMNFEGAFYNNPSVMLPVFSEKVKIESDNEQIEYYLADVVYENIPSENLNSVFLPDTLSDVPIFNAKVYLERSQPFLFYSLLPVRKNKATNQFQRIVSFSIYSKISSVVKKKLRAEHTYATNSLLSSGKWIKVRIDKEGIYKLSFAELKNYGIENPQNVRIFGFSKGTLPQMNSAENEDDLPEIKILIENEVVYFYGKPATVWYYDSNLKMFIPKKNFFADYNYYFITSDVNTGFDNKIHDYTKPQITVDKQVNSFIDYRLHEEDSENLVKSGRNWYGDAFTAETTKIFNDFNFTNLTTEDTAKFCISLAGRSNMVSSVFTINTLGLTKTLTLSGVNFGAEGGAYASVGTLSFYGLQSNAVNGGIGITVNFNRKEPSYNAWIDYIYVNAVRALKMSSGQFPFRYVEKSGKTQVVEFNLSNLSSNVKLWDVTDLSNVESIPLTITNKTSSFLYSSSNVHEFVAFDGTSVYQPVFIESEDVVENQNLHALSNVQMVILTHEQFLSQANELASLHKTYNGFSNVAVVTNEQVYNEFSSGRPDVCAMRNMLRMLYSRGKTNTNEQIRYLLILGDGSYDPKNVEYNNNNNTNFVLTYQSPESYSSESFTSDDFYGLLDDNEGSSGSLSGAIDIGVGRLPVKSQDEANVLLKKIKNYISNAKAGDWRNSICLISDDEDKGESFTISTEVFANIINKNYPVIDLDKIYLAAYSQEQNATGQVCPDVNALITNRIKKGVLVVNYNGHGNPRRLAHENVIGFNDIAQWDNAEKLPVMFTATCEFSRWDDPGFTSAGETILLSENGGSIAMFTTTRLVYENENNELNKIFYNNILKNNDLGVPNTFGDIYLNMKNKAIFINSKNNFTLLGDPALFFPVASANVVTTTINGKSIDQADTLKALSRIKISGYIADKDGNKLTNYSGTIYATVFDKAQELSTLSENKESRSVLKFSQQNSVVYKGAATVTNGDFSYEFIVPKDINYSLGNGRITYYAVNQNDNRIGVTTAIKIGGISADSAKDKTGPEVKLFLNDKNFVFGANTNPNPKIYAEIYDESGINTVGSGIGHDITAVIDNQESKALILNDSYQSEKDSYKKGKVEYSMSGLEPGPHTLKLKIWDVYNNSTETELDFVVVEDDNLKLDHVFNYPNPFTKSTWFYFNHNRPNQILDVQVQIFTVTGKLVRTLTSSFLSTGFLSTPILWDGLDDFGDKIGKGVYIYRVKVASEKDEKAEKYEKLLILK